MDLKKTFPVWRPYDHNLRAIASILAEADGDREKLARIRAFLEACGIPAGRAGEGECRKKSGQTLKMGDTGCKITLYFFFRPGRFVQRAEFYLLPNYHFTLLTK